MIQTMQTYKDNLETCQIGEHHGDWGLFVVACTYHLKSHSHNQHRKLVILNLEMLEFNYKKYHYTIKL